MILGIGTNMVEIVRIRKACEKEAFLTRTFTELECRQAKGNASVSTGNFAIEEAVIKSFETGFRTSIPGDIEVLWDELGKPHVVLYRGIKEVAESMGMSRIHISIANTSEYVLGFAVGEGER